MVALFRIKMCGISHRADVEQAIRAGADALGFNFYGKSLRYVSPADAKEMIQSVVSQCSKVGVFVNAPTHEIQAISDQCGLDAIQLHGDETPAMARELAPRAVIRAIRLPPNTNRDTVLRMIDPWAAARVVAILLDANVGPQTYGGSGQRVDWDLAAEICRASSVPIVLAGGLTPDNVRDAIRAVRPAGVDAASGVESFPGKKSAELMRRFVVAATTAFADYGKATK